MAKKVSFKGTSSFDQRKFEEHAKNMEMELIFRKQISDKTKELNKIADIDLKRATELRREIADLWQKKNLIFLPQREFSQKLLTLYKQKQEKEAKSIWKSMQKTWDRQMEARQGLRNLLTPIFGDLVNVFDETIAIAKSFKAVGKGIGDLFSTKTRRHYEKSEEELEKLAKEFGVTTDEIQKFKESLIVTAKTAHSEKDAMKKLTVAYQEAIQFLKTTKHLPGSLIQTAGTAGMVGTETTQGTSAKKIKNLFNRKQMGDLSSLSLFGYKGESFIPTEGATGAESLKQEQRQEYEQEDLETQKINSARQIEALNENTLHITDKFDESIMKGFQWLIDNWPGGVGIGGKKPGGKQRGLISSLIYNTTGIDIGGGGGRGGDESGGKESGIGSFFGTIAQYAIAHYISKKIPGFKQMKDWTKSLPRKKIGGMPVVGKNLKTLFNIKTGGAPGAMSFAKRARFAAGGKMLAGGIGGALGGYALDYLGEKAKGAGYEKTGAGLGVASSAVTGAGLGSMLGPIGTLVGGTAGLLYGLYKERKTLFGGGKEEGKKELSKLDEAKYDKIIAKAAEKYGVDPNLIKAVIQQESSFNERAIGLAGEKGLMQLMPGTAAEMGVKNAFNPEENIMGGTKYLAQQLEKYHGDVRLALSAYNAGTAIRTNQYSYVLPVMRRFERYSTSLDKDIKENNKRIAALNTNVADANKTWFSLDKLFAPEAQAATNEKLITGFDGMKQSFDNFVKNGVTVNLSGIIPQTSPAITAYNQPQTTTY